MFYLTAQTTVTGGESATTGWDKSIFNWKVSQTKVIVQKLHWFLLPKTFATYSYKIWLHSRRGWPFIQGHFPHTPYVVVSSNISEYIGTITLCNMLHIKQKLGLFLVIPVLNWPKKKKADYYIYWQPHIYTEPHRRAKNVSTPTEICCRFLWDPIKCLENV